MRDFSTIKRVMVSRSAREANRLIADDWILLDVSSYKGKAQFVLGREFDFDAKAFYEATCALRKAMQS
ncbi:MAG: hypothetical protein IJP86_05170 [Synergistaceae bacterium]|nr:hypothetical protein [Synergistaceae bacterium]